MLEKRKDCRRNGESNSTHLNQGLQITAFRFRLLPYCCTLTMGTIGSFTGRAATGTQGGGGQVRRAGRLTADRREENILCIQGRRHRARRNASPVQLGRGPARCNPPPPHHVGILKAVIFLKLSTSTTLRFFLLTRILP